MTVKKTAPKKTAKKAPAKKVSPMTEFEANLTEQVKMLQKDGFSVTIKCEDRNKQVKQGECVLDYIRANKPMNLIGCKSGAAARTVLIR